MNEEKQPNFPDKYHLSRKESVYLLKKNIVELVYNAGKFEGLNTTLLQTEEIIKYNRANNLAVDDVLTVVNLKRGFEMLLNDVQEPLIETSKRIKRIVAAQENEPKLYPLTYDETANAYIIKEGNIEKMDGKLYLSFVDEIKKELVFIQQYIDKYLAEK